jgi:hypothetical protein
MAGITATIRGQEPPAQSKVRLQIPGLAVTLPWWPSGIEWEDLADTWTQQGRPGRLPLLLRTSRTLPTLRMDFTLGTDFQVSTEATLEGLRKMAASKKPIAVWLGSLDRGQWRITDFSVSEREWAENGQASIADVGLALTRLSNAAIPIGPVKGRR